MHCNSLIAPGIFQLMATVGDVNQLHAELARRVLKAARLVAEFRGEKQQALGGAIRCKRQEFSIHTKDSVCGRASLAWANGTNWSRVGSAQQYQGSFR